MLEPGLALRDVATPHRRLPILRRPAFGVEMDELEGVLERQVRELSE
jgi:hypothetical protein